MKGFLLRNRINNLNLQKKLGAIVDMPDSKKYSVDDYLKKFLAISYQNCLTSPWVKDKVEDGSPYISLWFFAIKTREVFSCSKGGSSFTPLSQDKL